MVVSHEERVRAVEQAIVVDGPALEACKRHGAAVAGIARAMGARSLFGPGNAEFHTLGKVAECGFQFHAARYGCWPTVTPFPADGEPYRMDCDFCFGSVKVDVKGGWVVDKSHAKGSPRLSFGLMVPTEKIRDSDKSDFYVYCLCWRDTGYRVAPIGYATREMVSQAAIRNDVTHTCYVVPMSGLLPMAMFYDLVSGVGPVCKPTEIIEEV